MKQQYLPSGFGNPVQLIDSLLSRPETYWILRGEKRVLNLFHQMSERVPAYKDFLKKNKIPTEKIQTILDLKKVPTIDKDNYLRAYLLKDLCWDGKLSEKQWTIAATSGSTGDPFYFPRESSQDWQYAIIAEMYMRTNFEIHKKTTLYID